MASNQVFDHGDAVSLPVPAGTKSGDAVRVGELNGVALTDRANNSDPKSATYNFGGGNPDGFASIRLAGAFKFDVEFEAAPGDPVYLGGNGLTDDSTDADLFGHALTSKAAAPGPLTVRLAN